MSFIEEHLMPEEKITYRTEPHWIIFLYPIVLIVFGLLIYFYMPYLDKFAMIIIIVAAFMGLMAFLSYRYTEYAVTNLRVIAKKGVISRSTRGIVLDKIEGIDVAQSIWARMLGCGTVIVRGTGGTRDLFYLVNHPFELRNNVQNALHAVKKG